MKQFSDSKCTLDDENNYTDPERIEDCSFIEECYNFDLGKYDNSKCRDEEQCAHWETKNTDGTESTHHGCVLSKYCDVLGEWDGQLTEYLCPSDEDREDPIIEKPGYYSKEKCQEYYIPE